MGERGPLPKPQARRRNTRRSNAKAIVVARPPTPSMLKGEARKEWLRVVPELEEAGVLARIDRAVLIRYCTAWADWIELDGLLQRSGKLIRGRRDALVRNPLWLLRRDAEQTVTELARQLGLSPVSRLRAGIAHERPASAEPGHGVVAIEAYRRMLEEPDRPDPRLALKEAK